MERLRDISGAILAGGKSSRMGHDKALLDLHGKPFLSHIVGTLQKVFKRVVVISDRGERYAFLKIPVFPDFYHNCGPLAGIHSALSHSKTGTVFIISCDLPQVTADLIRSIAASADGDVTLPRSDERIQPLCAVYRKSFLPVASQHLSSKKYAVVHALREASVRVKEIEIDRPIYDSMLESINTLADYRLCLQRGESARAR